MAATRQHRLRPPRTGDWIEVHVVGGGPPRRGQVTEVLGRGAHERYRVRWDEEHESIHYPAGGTVVATRRNPRRRSAVGADGAPAPRA